MEPFANFLMIFIFSNVIYHQSCGIGVRSSSREKVAAAASGEGEQSDKVWELLETVADFKSDV